MTIVGTASAPLDVYPAVPLALYAQMIHWDECAFWGVDRDRGAGYAEYGIWIKPERDMLRRYLGEAQSEIEAVVGYPLATRWIEDEKHPYAFPLLTKYGKVIESGVRSEAIIEEDAAVNHATDPATVTVTTTVTDESEIRVCYPTSLGVEGPVEISPSDIDIAAGTATIYIPRCRLVHPDHVDNPSTGLDYTDLTNFLEEVDVTRVTNDDSDQATLIWPHVCTGSSCSCPTCDDYTQVGCVYVANGEIGQLEILPAEYSGGSWTAKSTQCYGEPEFVTVNYRAGMLTTTRQAIDAVIHLAHAKMSPEPCTNARLQTILTQDQRVPDVVTRERINCPFGMADGAWKAYKFALSMKLWRGRTMGRRGVRV